MVEAMGILAALPRRLAGILFALTRRPRGWFLYAAALIIYPAPYYLAYPQPKYRYAIEPELLLLGVYLVFVLWGEIRQYRGSQLGQRSRTSFASRFLVLRVSLFRTLMKTILVVDDEPAARYALSRALENRYRIVEADSSGCCALGFTRRSRT